MGKLKIYTEFNFLPEMSGHKQRDDEEYKVCRDVPAEQDGDPLQEVGVVGEGRVAAVGALCRKQQQSIFEDVKFE